MKHQLLARHPIGNARRVWKQDHLILSVASPGPMDSKFKGTSELTLRKTRRAVQTSIDAGFNLIGCLWADPEMAMDIVRTAESLGGNVQFQDIHRYGGMGSKNIFCETNDYQGVLKDLEPWNCVKSLCLWDEPLLEDHLRETHRMIEYCEKVRPAMLPYTVANPDYSRSFNQDITMYQAYIDQFLEVIDPAQMSFDYYPIGRPEYDPALQLDNSTMWIDLELVRRAAQKHGVPFWFWYQGHRYHFHKIFYNFTFPMARSMAYAGILHGIKGVECYNEFDGFIDPATGGPGVFFEEHKKLNRELHFLGNTLMALVCKRVIHDESLLPDHPAMEEFRTSIEESELVESALLPRISISEHEDEYGNQYLMVLNRDFEQDAHIELTLKHPSHVYEISKEDGEQHLQYETAFSLPMHLDAGDLRLYRIQPAEEEPFTIEYYLDK